MDVLASSTSHHYYAIMICMLSKRTNRFRLTLCTTKTQNVHLAIICLHSWNSVEYRYSPLRLHEFNFFPIDYVSRSLSIDVLCCNFRNRNLFLNAEPIHTSITACKGELGIMISKYLGGNPADNLFQESTKHVITRIKINKLLNLLEVISDHNTTRMEIEL